MAKRRANKQLNKDEADIDDEEEDSGEFQKADPREIENRVIKTARRRTEAGSAASSPLANFSGFSKAPKDAPFSFFGKPSTSEKSDPKTECSATAENKDLSSTKPRDLDALKALNLSCSSWIQQHLERNPYVLLLPVFRDYEKHLATLNLNTPSSAPTTVVSTLSSSKTFTVASLEKAATSSIVSSSAPTFSFGSTNSTGTATEPKPFSFGVSKPTADSTATVSSALETPKFSFGLNNGGLASSSLPFGKTPASTSSAKPDLEAPALPFSGGLLGAATTPVTPFSGGILSSGTALAPPSNPEAVRSEEGDASDEPPQFDFVPVGEEGSVFDIRCKVFFKQDNSFKSVGVGTLYLKPVSEGKSQLIARADTTQGSVLLNILLTPDLPLQRTGSNNVLLVCVPTPDAQPPPVPVLIRVKSLEERERLYGEMERLRKL